MNENIDMEDKKNINESEINGFRFSKLSEIPSMDYRCISVTCIILKRFVTIKQFYENFDNCLSYTYDFILTYSSLLIKNVDSNSALLSLLALLKNVASGMNAFAFPIEPENINRILVLLINLMESPQQDNVKCEGGKILADIIEMQNIGSCDQSYLSRLISQVYTLFDTPQCVCELYHLLGALLKRRADINIEMQPIISRVESDSIKYLHPESDPQLLLQLLECLVSYYKTREERDAITDALKRSLCNLCVFMSNSLLRNSAEQLLAILVEELYCTHTLIWPGGRDGILKDIQALPSNYEEWPNVDENIFFVIAYLLYLHSELLWNSTDIWECLSYYLSINIVIPQLFLLKALLLLYPLTVNNDAIINSNINKNNCNVLIDILETCKSLSQLLTYHHKQMVWLLTNAKTPLKNLVLVSWLRVQNEDVEILDVFNVTQMGSLLVKFLVNYPNIPVASRVSQLIAKLTLEPKLDRTVGLALPLLCTRPTVFAQLLQINPTIPADPVNILDLIKMVAASLPFLTEDTAIQATCFYTIRLLTATKSQPNAVRMFCHYLTSVKFLIAKSAAIEDATALAAINLIRRLLNNQVRNNVEMDNSVPVPFTKILQGNSERVSAGLKLLQILLNHRKQVLLLNMPKRSLLGLYHLLHTLTLQQEMAPQALIVLTQLILLENNLAYSLETPHIFRLICKKQMHPKTIRPFLEFIKVWLNYTSKYPYVQVPVVQLLCFLEKIEQRNDDYHRITQLLGNYQQGQRQL